MLSIWQLFTSKKLKNLLLDGAIPLPGPTPIPIIGSLHKLTEPMENTFTRWAKQYGPIYKVKIGTRTLIVISDTEVAQDLFISAGSIYSSRMYGSSWKRMRSSISLGVRQNIIDTAYQPIIDDQIRLFLRRLQAKTINEDPAVNIKQDLGLMLTNTFAIIVYGYRVKLGQNDPLLVKYNQAAEKFNFIFGIRATLLDYFPLLRYLPSSKEFERKVIAARQDYRDITEQLFNETQKRMEKNGPTTETCFAAQMLKNVKKDDQYSTSNSENGLKDASDLCNTFMFAATRSTMSSQYRVLLFMAAFPEVQKRIQDELDKVAGKGKLYTLEQESDLHYMRAVIKEVIRFKPIAPFGFPHKATYDNIYRGYHIPADASIVLNLGPINKNPLVYQNPEKFWPERYLDEQGHYIAHDDNLDPWTFGKGRRGCPGINLAYREMFMITGYTLALFKIEPDIDSHTSKPMKINLDAEIADLDKIKLRFETRDGVDFAAALRYP
ncbi:hypothetical protein G9A89_021745 [Geosiphon pyriformis]|nr:hypothetical protein G9A89_021745 [Geosiphon pyriformis]